MKCTLFDCSIAMGIGNGKESLGKLSDRRQMRQNTEESLETALEFLAKFGVAPNKKPTVRQLEIDCPNDSDAIATANLDIESQRKFNEVVGSWYVKADYKYFGLSISDSAVEEYYSAVFDENRLEGAETMIPEMEGNEDISLFRPALKNLESLEAVLVHEIWHVIEGGHGYAKKQPFILEGTATFVENLFNGIRTEKPRIESHDDILYHLGAWIVAKELRGEKNPLKALLTSRVRKRIAKAFQNEALPLFGEKISKTYKPSASREMAKREILISPSYGEFRENPSRKTYLSALRHEGYFRIAKEIANQDTAKLIRFKVSLLKGASNPK